MSALGGKLTSPGLAVGMLARKVILHSPVSDEHVLEPFVEQCLRDKVSILAIVGPECSRLEDLVDEIVVGDGSDDSRFLLTTSHRDETLEDVMHMLLVEMAGGGPVQEIRL
jgi:hypothetical protein